MHDIARRADIRSKMAGALGVGTNDVRLTVARGSLRMQVEDILRHLAITTSRTLMLLLDSLRMHHTRHCESKAPSSPAHGAVAATTSRRS